MLVHRSVRKISKERRQWYQSLSSMLRNLRFCGRVADGQWVFQTGNRTCAGKWDSRPFTANPGTTAEQNRSYFESLAETWETHASDHFIIGISGEIIQCIPCNEISYASNDRNSDTISIECCIPDESGKFTDETYQSLVELVAWLMGRYELTADDVIRHYDVTGKDCPKYFVENSNAWSDFKTDLLDIYRYLWYWKNTGNKLE